MWIAADVPRRSAPHAGFGIGAGLLCEFPAVFWAAAAIRRSQSQAIKSEDPFEVCKEHLDLHPLPPRCDIGFCFGDVVRHVASALINVTRYLARRGVRPAFGFQGQASQ